MQKKTAKKFDVLGPYNFLQDFLLEACKAKRRVWTQTMYIRPGKVASQVFAALKTSAASGIDTKLHIDSYDLIRRIGYFNGREQIKQQVFPKLKSAGVKVLFTNPPTLIEKILPYKGRNHIKITLVDDIAYLGGINFADKDFSYLDFMVKITSKLIVSTIADQFTRIDKEEPLSSKKIHADEDTTILIDAGKSGKSIILDSAVDLIRKAKRSIFHVSQLTPDGKFLQALHAMHTKGVRVKVITSKNKTDRIFALIDKMNQIEMHLRNCVVPITLYPSIIHAKLTIIDEKIALFGSHNMSEKGVKMGTQEIGVQTKNITLLKDLINFYSMLGP